MAKVIPLRHKDRPMRLQIQLLELQDNGVYIPAGGMSASVIDGTQETLGPMVHLLRKLSEGVDKPR